MLDSMSFTFTFSQNSSTLRASFDYSRVFSYWDNGPRGPNSSSRTTFYNIYNIAIFRVANCILKKQKNSQQQWWRSENNKLLSSYLLLWKILWSDMNNETKYPSHSVSVKIPFVFAALKNNIYAKIRQLFLFTQIHHLFKRAKISSKMWIRTTTKHTPTDSWIVVIKACYNV